MQISNPNPSVRPGPRGSLFDAQASQMAFLGVSYDVLSPVSRISTPLLDMRCLSPTQPTVLHGIVTKIRLFIVWINGTVLWTVSPHPSTLQDCSLLNFRSSRSANCQR